MHQHCLVSTMIWWVQHKLKSYTNLVVKIINQHSLVINFTLTTSIYTNWGGRAWGFLNTAILQKIFGNPTVTLLHKIIAYTAYCIKKCIFWFWSIFENKYMLFSKICWPQTIKKLWHFTVLKLSCNNSLFTYFFPAIPHG